jgi:hypothetical protein
MRTSIRAVAGVLAVVGTLTACDDYLTGPGITDDPNQPTQASLDQLFYGSQQQQYLFHTGDLARHAAMWTQQMGGIGNQTTSLYQYVVNEQNLNGAFSQIYSNGGLIGLRTLQARADSAQDKTYSGIAKVYEGFLMGMASSMWGALPYSEAVSDATRPKLDPQEEVYRDVQAKLDAGIADLTAGTGAGPGVFDLSFGGNRQRWIETAWTLKARFYMHWVEAQGVAATQAAATVACGGNCVSKARDAALKGITAPANDFKAVFSTTPNEQNLWYQFIYVNRTGQMAAGKTLVDLMNSRNDPRRATYFSQVGGQYVGATDLGPANASLLSADRANSGFDQPMVTFAETQLILAEANYRLGTEAPALVNLNAARTSAGLTALAGVSGNGLFTEIMLEKYIALFQNPEVWNDYKRTCIPNLVPVRGNEVYARLLYGNTERNNNPNIPAPAGQPVANRNDPKACTGPRAA